MSQDDFSDDEDQIINNCLKWRQNTIHLIIDEKWDQIESNPCPYNNCFICEEKQLPECPLQPLFVYPHVFTIKIQSIIERIYGPQTSNSWFKMILKYYPKLTILQYFIENRLIDIHNGSYNYTLFSKYAISYRYGTIYKWGNYLLSEEVGYNINIQDCAGENVLLTYLRFSYYDEDDFFPQEREEKHLLNYNENIIYLLEKGADPLLEDFEGISSLEYARNLSTFPQDQKDRLIQLLEQYQ